MKVRIKFTKLGDLKFIGHLDMMRFFQKAIRRAGLDIRYSEGFNPHQIMSFAAPLGLGDTSICEYMDIDLADTAITGDEIVKRLNAVSVPGITILSAGKLPEKCKNAMASTIAADYLLTFREGFIPEEGQQEFFRKVEEFAGRPEIPVMKKTKKSETIVDIRPLILDCKAREDGLFVRCLAGSTENLKPEMIPEAYMASRGEELSPLAVAILRMELYARNDSDELICLEALGEPF